MKSLAYRMVTMMIEIIIGTIVWQAVTRKFMLVFTMAIRRMTW